MSLKRVIKHVKQFNKDNLLDHISTLYKNYPAVEEYFEFLINEDEKRLLENYKHKIKDCFYSKRLPEPNYQKASDHIKDFKLLKPSHHSMINLLLYYIECGVEYSYDYGKLSQHAYGDLADKYNTALHLIRRRKLLETYEDAAYNMVVETESIGGEFHNALHNTFYNFYQ